ncbi:hypothetical protein ACFVZR_15185 [Streptomyces sp. NPDC058316]|uniref:hypothetical protein n=1 Tax=unclassified Streptomyces TaxID=2593676 RepID=UPI003436B066
MPVDPELNLPEKVKRQYDLIGFDPRGAGQSAPVGCGLTDDEKNDERSYKAETFAKDVEWARTVADKCRAKGGDTLRHLTTARPSTPARYPSPVTTSAPSCVPCSSTYREPPKGSPS